MWLCILLRVCLDLWKRAWVIWTKLLSLLWTLAPNSQRIQRHEHSRPLTLSREKQVRMPRLPRLILCSSELLKVWFYLIHNASSRGASHSVAAWSALAALTCYVAWQSRSYQDDISWADWARELISNHSDSSLLSLFLNGTWNTKYKKEITTAPDIRGPHPDFWSKYREITISPLAISRNITKRNAISVPIGPPNAFARGARFRAARGANLLAKWTLETC